MNENDINAPCAMNGKYGKISELSGVRGSYIYIYRVRYERRYDNAPPMGKPERRRVRRVGDGQQVVELRTDKRTRRNASSYCTDE